MRLRLVGGVLILLMGGCGSSSPTSAAGPQPGGSGGPGTTIHRAVPSVLGSVPMTNQRGERVRLSTWRGRTILLVPFLTLCQDICPFTTGNLVQVQEALRADHAASSVEIVELTVDPARDSSARLAAYARLTNATWQLVRTPSPDLARLAKFFGFFYAKVPEDGRNARDWLTGKPLTYDVDHSDNYFVIDPAGVERVVQDAAPDFHGRLNPKLYNFLDALGRQHLAHAPQPDWTPVDVLDALLVVVGRRLPVVPSS